MNEKPTASNPDLLGEPVVENFTVHKEGDSRGRQSPVRKQIVPLITNQIPRPASNDRGERSRLGSPRKPIESDYYDWLGLDVGATGSQIKKAYNSLALKHHPDRNLGSDSKDNSDEFIKINEAYEILSSKKYRYIYDTFGFKKSDFAIIYGGLGKFVGDYLGVTHIEPLIGKVRLYYKIMDVVEGMIMRSSEEYDRSDNPKSEKDDGSMSDILYDVLKKHDSKEYDKFLDAPIRLLEEKLEVYTGHLCNIEELEPSDSLDEFRCSTWNNAERSLRGKVKSEIESVRGKISPSILKVIGKVYYIEAESWLNSLNNSQSFIARQYHGIKGRINTTFRTASLRLVLMTKIVLTTVALVSKIRSMSRASSKSDLPSGNSAHKQNLHYQIPQSPAKSDNGKGYQNGVLSPTLKGKARDNGSGTSLDIKRDEEARKQSLKCVLENLMQLMSYACNLEALTTAKKMCDSILKNDALSPNIKRLKCRALKIISEEYSTIDAPPLTMDLEF